MALFAFLALVAFEYERSTDDWFRLVVECQTQEHRLDSTDRRFLRYMANELTAHEEAFPTPPQQRWLLDIKRRLNLHK